jgi:hypothetical protein
MDKNNIKKHLVNKFVNEATPGIDVTRAVLTKSKAFNDEGLKDIEDKLKSADNAQKKSASSTKEMPQNKFNYNNDKESEYHQEMEIMNGQEMIEYDREPNQMFKDRATKGIEGHSTMGNSPDYANVYQEEKGFTGPTFGKKLVQAIKDSNKKRQNAVKGIISFGDDIETVSKNYAPMSKFSAMFESIHKTPKMEDDAIDKPEDDIEDISQADISGDNYEKASREIEYGIKPFKENKTNNKPQIKEGMKRLKFKQEFKGVGNALKLIPESYKVDNKVFEMTDGVESYRMRWEGNINEGRAIVLMASDKTMVNEDMQKMKHLMGYKSQETLGAVKGKARIDENKVFSDIWKKSVVLIEGEDIEAQKAPEKKTDEKLPHAPEAKKHVQGSVEKKVEMEISDKSESEVEFDKIDVPQASEAKKGIKLGESYFAPMDEAWMEEMMHGEMEEGMYEEGMDEFEDDEEDTRIDYSMGKTGPNQMPPPPKSLNIDLDEEMDEMYSFEEGDDIDEMYGNEEE